MEKRPELVNGRTVPYGESLLTLQTMLGKEMPEPLLACLALGHRSDREAFEILVGLFEAKDWVIRRTAAEAVRFHPLGFHAASQLINLLHDPSRYVIRTTCETLSLLKIAGSHDYIVNLLTTDDSYTREVALRSIVHLWQEKDFERILDIFKYDQSARVRKEAAYILKSNANSHNWKELSVMWAQDSLPCYRVWAAELAGEFGDQSVLTILRSLADDNDGHVHKAALVSLKRLGC